VIKKLTARTVKSVKASRTRIEYHDSDVRGLSLRVTPNGVKSWTVLYRHRGRLRRLTLGDAAAVSLADARKRAKDELSKASTGADPAAAKQAHRRAETIADLAGDYIEKHAKRLKRSWREDRRILDSTVLPAWKHRAIADVTRRDVRELLEPITERAPVMANRTLALVRKMFSFAVDQELIEHNPAARMGRPGAEQARARVLTEDELRALWQACDALAPEMAAYFKLRLVTAQRGKEVASMRWQDVDLENGWWTIPPAIAKNKLAHRVPLSPTAAAIVKALDPGEKEERPDYVLDGARGRRQHSEAAATFTVADFRGHDLRRTAASLMAGGGVPRLVIGKLLNHVETGVTAIYDRHSYDAEKQAALAWWDVKLTAILKNERGKVLAFSR
jgi:integrase